MGVSGDKAVSVAAADADAGDCLATAACAKDDERVENVRRDDPPDCGCNRRCRCEIASH